MALLHKNNRLKQRELVCFYTPTSLRIGAIIYLGVTVWLHTTLSVLP